MNNKIIRSLLISLLLLLLPFVAACGNTEDECTHADSNGDGICDECDEVLEEITDGTDGLVLIKDGAPTFKFVVGTGASDAMQDVDKLIEKLNSRLSGTVERVVDAKDTEADVEIIVGSVKNRGADYKIDEHYLGHNGYAVKVIGNKIVLLAGDEGKYDDALGYLEKEIFDLDNKKADLTSLTVTEGMCIEKLTEYGITSFTAGGVPLNDFVIAITMSNANMSKMAELLQTFYYRNTGAYLDIVSVNSLDEGQPAIIFTKTEAGGEGSVAEGYRAYLDTDGCIRVETEFLNKLVDATEKVLITELFDTNKTEIKIQEDFDKRVDVRNIYYADFGARGDGVTDDFLAIRACHEYANEHGHTVNAEAGATYYIGGTNASGSAIIKTNTNWHGAKFIFDDRELTPTDNAGGKHVFRIESDYKRKTYGASNSPISSIEKGATSVGFAPGYPALVMLYNDNVKQYIRYGSNQNNGDSMHELVLVDKDGNIDTSTPLQWTYDTITKLYVYRVDEKPVTLDGGGAVIETLFTQAAFYSDGDKYMQRGIEVSRSNTVVKNFEHKVIGEDVDAARAHRTLASPPPKTQIT